MENKQCLKPPTRHPHGYIMIYHDISISFGYDHTLNILVDGLNPSEKYESQLGLFFPIYGKKRMFQTTSQHL